MKININYQIFDLINIIELIKDTIPQIIFGQHRKELSDDEMKNPEKWFSVDKSK